MNKKVKKQFTDDFLDELVYGLCDEIGLDSYFWEKNIRKAATQALKYVLNDYKVSPRDLEY